MVLPIAIRHQLKRSEVMDRFLALASWTVIAFAFDKLAMVANTFFLARILGIEDFGRLTLAQGLINTTQIFILLGAGTVLARYIPAMRQESMRRAVEVINLCWLVVICASAVFAIAGLLCGPLIAKTVLDLEAASYLPYFLVSWTLLTALNNMLLSILLSFEKGKAMGFVSFVSAAMSVLAVPLSADAFGLTGAIIAMVGIEIVKGLLLFYMYRQLLAEHGVQITARPRKSDVPLLWHFGLPVFISSAIWAPTIWLAQFIVKIRAPDGLEAVGVFGFTNNLLGAVILLSGLTNRAAFPIQSSLHAKGQHKELKRLSGILTLGQIGTVLILAIPMMLLSPQIMAAAGSEFENYWPVLLIMITTGIVIAGQSAIGNHFLVYGMPYFIMNTLIPWALIILAFSFFASKNGAYALSFGLLFASIARTVLFYLKWHKHGLQMNVSGV